MPLRVAWHLAVQVFAPRITSESRLKQPGPDLMGGHWPLSDYMERQVSDYMERHLPLLALTCEW
jgi:hypothetical protein